MEVDECEAPIGYIVGWRCLPAPSLSQLALGKTGGRHLERLHGHCRLCGRRRAGSRDWR